MERGRSATPSSNGPAGWCGPAKILGVADRLGTITEGKIANLIVTDGDPLEITTQVRHLIVDGREVDTMDRHRALYERYRSRPMPRR